MHYAFGTHAGGSEKANKVLWALQRRPNGMTRTEISTRVYGGNSDAIEIDQDMQFSLYVIV